MLKCKLLVGIKITTEHFYDIFLCYYAIIMYLVFFWNLTSHILETPDFYLYLTFVKKVLQKTTFKHSGKNFWKIVYFWLENKDLTKHTTPSI